MDDDPKPIKYLKEIGAAFKLGSGVLGKSAIAVGILIVVGGIAIYRLKSDNAILLALGLIVVAFFLWFFPVIRFVGKHPDAALLEGAEWTGFHRFQAAAKGYIPTAEEQKPSLSPGSTINLSLVDNTPKQSDSNKEIT
ncbi:MAG: hypothetical protein WBQ85_06380 [Candidatus Sulfotelmatobacter sp.]